MDPDLLAYLARRSGIAPPDLSLDQPAQVAPPVAEPTGQSPESTPAMPSATAPDYRSMLYQNLGQMAKQLGPDFDPNAMRAAQQQDIQTGRLRTTAAGLDRASALLRNQPVSETAPYIVSNEDTQRLAQRQGAVLGTADAAMKLQGMLMQQSLFDPHSPMSRAKQEQMLRMDPDFVTQRYGGEAGLRQVPGFLIDQDMAMREKLAGVQKTSAEATKTAAEIPGVEAGARKTQAEAKAAEIESGPVAPAVVAMAQKMGVSLPSDTTNKQARDILDAEAKRQGIALDWSKLGLEREKVQVEAARYTSEHPDEPVPGFKWSGPGGAPARDSEPVKQLQDRAATAQTMKKTLMEMKAIIARTNPGSRLVGPDAHRLEVLTAKLHGMLAKSEGKLSEYSLNLAKAQLPDPSSIKMWHTGIMSGVPGFGNKMSTAIDELIRGADRDVTDYAAAHQFSGQPTQVVTRADPKTGEIRFWDDRSSSWVKE